MLGSRHVISLVKSFIDDDNNDVQATIMSGIIPRALYSIINIRWPNSDVHYTSFTAPCNGLYSLLTSINQGELYQRTKWQAADVGT